MSNAARRYGAWRRTSHVISDYRGLDLHDLQFVIADHVERRIVGSHFSRIAAERRAADMNRQQADDE